MEKRFVEIETRVTYLEATVDDLNKVVTEQSLLLKKLERKIQQLLEKGQGKHSC